MSVKVILADDHQMFREGLRSLMERQTDIEIIAEAADGRSIVKLLQEVSPDVIIMDVSILTSKLSPCQCTPAGDM